jgi:hypothetical protein
MGHNEIVEAAGDMASRANDAVTARKFSLSTREELGHGHIWLHLPKETGERKWW